MIWLRCYPFQEVHYPFHELTSQSYPFREIETCEEIDPIPFILKLLDQEKGIVLPFCIPSICSCNIFVASPNHLLANEELVEQMDIKVNITHYPKVTLR